LLLLFPFLWFQRSFFRDQKFEIFFISAIIVARIFTICVDVWIQCFQKFFYRGDLMRKFTFLIFVAFAMFFVLSCEKEEEKSPYDVGDSEKEGIVSTPKFSTPPGVYQEELSIEVTVDTKDAKIYYTLDGSVPDDTSEEYDQPFEVEFESTKTIKVIGIKEGMESSSVVTGVFEVTGQLDVPSFSITPGVYTEPQSLALSHYDDEAVIRYTTDGTEPTSKSQTYSTPITLPAETEVEVRAKAFRNKWADSETLVGNFIITGTLEAPEFLTEPGIYTEATNVVISTENTEAEIRYEVYGTEGGADPTSDSTLYTQPFLVPGDTVVTVKAALFREGWVTSPVISGKFTVTGTAERPVFSPIEGTYTSEQSVTITVDTEGAMIRYTTDGTEPTELSPLHSTPISVPLNTQTIIKAKAFKKDWVPSATVGGNYNVTGKVATPSFSIIPNYYTTAQNVAISSTTDGASIRFTVDGSEPTKTHGFEYTGPIAVPSTTTLKAFAYKTDWMDSEVIEGTYNITGQVQAPVFTPEAGNYTDSMAITLNSNVPGVTIKYTIDGTNPTRTDGMIYSNPFTISQTRTVKAVAFRSDWEDSSDSDVSSATYTITGRVVAPRFSIEPGNYTTSKNVQITTETAGAVIRYTTDGSDPTRTNGLPYSSEVTVDKSMTLKAIAYKTDWEESSNSEIAEGIYNITGNVVLPAITPVNEFFTSSVEVEISCATEDAVIRYTTDGSNPTRNFGDIYTGSFTISSNATVKAIAYKTDWEESSNSQISSRSYTITGKAENPKFSVAPGFYTNSVSLTLSTDTPGAKIRYTVDGSDPTRTTGALATGAISIPSTRTVKAIAFHEDWEVTSDSNVVSGLYTITGKVSPPVFNIESGNYTAGQAIEISSDTPGAVIRYTLDGSNPTRISGFLYTSPFTIDQQRTVKAIAYVPDWEESSNSAITTAIYNITGTVASPRFSIDPGNYTTSKNVQITTETTGAVIRYTTDDSDPSRTNGLLYSGAISISSTTTLKAVAYKTDWEPSSDSTVISGLYTITGKVINPVITPLVQNHTDSVDVEISTPTEDAVIRYTTDGVTNPTRFVGTIYNEGSPFTVSSSSTVKAIAYRTDWEETSNSDVVSKAYAITGKVEPPKLSVEPGNYTDAVSLTLSTATTGAKIRYTTDGTEPTRTVGTLYSSAISISSTRTIKAIAFKDDWQPDSDSNIVEALYTITGKVSTPVLSPIGGFFTENSTVTITSDTDGAIIRYTIDGTTTPNRNTGIIYTGPFTVSSTTTVRTMAYKTDWQSSSDSSVASGLFTITGKVANPVISPSSGYFMDSQNVTISTSTTGAKIKYTTDDTVPSRINGILYSGSFSVDSSSTVRAIAYKEDWEESSNSDITEEEYIITGKVATPVFNPAGGNYTEGKLVSMSTETELITGDVLITYTLNGDDPTRMSQQYTDPVLINSDTTLKAMAFVPQWDSESDSNISISNYNITGVLPPPEVSPYGGGSFVETVTVTLSSVETGAKIRYTLDGVTDPSRTSGILYSGSITITESSELRAMAYVEDWEEDSDSVVEATYFTITGNVQTPVLSPPQGVYGPDPVYLTITTATSGAQIVYTDNNTEPQVNSEGEILNGNLYTGDFITINNPKFIRAIAFKTDWTTSLPTTGHYQMKVGNPVFSPAGGTYSDTVNVNISTSTPGATILYTTDGSTPEPPATGEVFDGDIAISSNTNLKAVAFKSEWLDSNVAQSSYNMRAAQPTFSVPSGVYTKNRSMEIFTTTPNPREIWWIDKSVDVTGYSFECVPLSGSEDHCTCRYKKPNPEYNPSDPLSEEFLIIAMTKYNTGTPFSIFYTRDLMAIACRPGWEKSPEANNSIEIKVATPFFTFTGGDYVMPLNNIEIKTDPPGAGFAIWYTTDGSEPGIGSPSLQYSAPISINKSTVLKARVFKSGLTDSEVATEVFFNENENTAGLVEILEAKHAPELPEQPYDIQEAINWIDANREDPGFLFKPPIVVTIPEGTYNQTINMKAGISLIGEDEAEVTIIGSATSGNTIVFSSEHIDSTTFIENLTIIGSGSGPIDGTHGIRISGSASPTIRGCIIHGGAGPDISYAIYNGGGTPQIIGNTIYGGSSPESYGIYNQSLRPLIENNYIYGGESSDGGSVSYGIYNYLSSPLIISNEIVSGDSEYAYGVFNIASSNVRVFGNDISGCTNCDTSAGIYVHDDSEVFVANNTIHGGHALNKSFGIENFSKNIYISNNTISGGSAPEVMAVYNHRPSGSSESLSIHLKNNVFFVDHSVASFCLYEANSASSFSGVRNNVFYRCPVLIRKGGSLSVTDILELNAYNGMSSNVRENPGFYNESERDWRPGQSINNGLNLYYDHYFPVGISEIDWTEVPVDKEWTPRSTNFPDTPWWIGAYEM
jgi:hypothetical protein